MRKGQLYGVLGDRGGKAKGPFEELAEVRGADYDGHHRCIVFGSGGSPAELEKRPWTPTPPLGTGATTEGTWFSAPAVDGPTLQRHA